MAHAATRHNARNVATAQMGVTQRLSGRERTFEGWAHNVSDLGVAWPQTLGLRMGQCPRLWHLGGLGGCSVDGRGPFLLPSTID